MSDRVERTTMEEFTDSRGVVYNLLLMRPAGGDNHFWIEKDVVEYKNGISMGIEIYRSRVQHEIYEFWDKIVYGTAYS